MPTESELFSAVDALLEQVPSDDLPPPAERRRLREAAGLSQTQIATALGTRREAVGSWEAGQREPRPPQRAAYARLLSRPTATQAAPTGRTRWPDLSPGVNEGWRGTGGESGLVHEIRRETSITPGGARRLVESMFTSSGGTRRHSGMAPWEMTPAPIASAFALVLNRAADGAPLATTEVLPALVNIRRGRSLPNCCRNAAPRREQREGEAHCLDGHVRPHRVPARSLR